MVRGVNCALLFGFNKAIQSRTISDSKESVLPYVCVYISVLKETTGKRHIESDRVSNISYLIWFQRV